MMLALMGMLLLGYASAVANVKDKSAGDLDTSESFGYGYGYSGYGGFRPYGGYGGYGLGYGGKLKTRVHT